jgi:hypothetical protein
MLRISQPARWRSLHREAFSGALVQDDKAQRSSGSATGLTGPKDGQQRLMSRSTSKCFF